MRLKTTILLSALLLSTNLYAGSLQTANSVNHTTPKVVWQDALNTVSQSVEIDPYGKLVDLNNRSYVFLSHYPASQTRHPFIDEGEFLESVSSNSPNEGIDFEQNPFIYGSGYHDSESGLEYMGARYYSAYIGRFVAQDSFDLLNRYNYGNANPIMTIDPNGHLALSSLINYTLSAVGIVGGVAALISTSGAALPLIANIAGIASASLSVMAQLGVDFRHWDEREAAVFGTVSESLGIVSLAADVSSAVMTQVGRYIARHSKKAIILDLDDTMWKLVNNPVESDDILADPYTLEEGYYNVDNAIDENVVVKFNRSRVQQIVDFYVKNQSVDFYVVTNGSWDKNQINNFFVHNKMTIKEAYNKDDNLRLGFNRNKGEFITKSKLFDSYGGVVLIDDCADWLPASGKYRQIHVNWDEDKPFERLEERLQFSSRDGFWI